VNTQWLFTKKWPDMGGGGLHPKPPWLRPWKMGATQNRRSNVITNYTRSSSSPK